MLLKCDVIGQTEVTLQKIGSNLAPHTKVAGARFENPTVVPKIWDVGRIGWGQTDLLTILFVCFSGG